MEQLHLFPEEAPPHFPWRLRLTGRTAEPALEDLIGLHLTRLPPPPDDDPAFDRFGLFVEDLPRQELATCLAAHQLPAMSVWNR